MKQNWGSVNVSEDAEMTKGPGSCALVSLLTDSALHCGLQVG